ncbi:MAG: TauD/TfdA family dioxygenase, partial [Proteobacteria bacterium]|nr:TauD/TfdA family dioxygenase [Pseudomonadota bacterium]
MTAYAELQVTSNYSFLRGGSHPDELVLAAKALGLAALGIADRNTLAGVVRAHVAAKQAGLTLLVGARLVPEDGPEVLCYPRDRAAYGRLCRLLTLGKRRAAKGDCRFTLAELEDHGAGQTLIVLPPEVPAAPGPGFRATLARLGRRFAGSCYLAGQVLYRGDDARALGHLSDLAAACGTPLVASNDVRLHTPARRALLDGVYDSTEFPAQLQIELHNELSYGACWPSRIYFFCRRPAREGGETPIADSREILRRLDPAIARRFAERGVRYSQNLRDRERPGAGKSWQDTFETDERATVEAHCRKAGMDWRWTERGLSTSVVRPGVLRHPATGEAVWFNQADQWHAALAGVKHPDARPRGGRCSRRPVRRARAGGDRLCHPACPRQGARLWRGRVARRSAAAGGRRLKHPGKVSSPRRRSRLGSGGACRRPGPIRPGRMG